MHIRIPQAAARLALIVTVLLSVKTYAQGPPPPPGTPQAAGRDIFLNRCASCHGTNGNGGNLLPGIATRVPLRSDDDLIRILHSGLPSSGMPAFPDIVDPVRANLIAYLRTLRVRGETEVTHMTVQLDRRWRPDRHRA